MSRNNVRHKRCVICVEYVSDGTAGIDNDPNEPAAVNYSDLYDVQPEGTENDTIPEISVAG